MSNDIPAFPVPESSSSAVGRGLPATNTGMTLRDYFAAAALTGILARGSTPNTIPAGRDTRAKTAYAWADAMMAAREKAQENDPTE